MHKFKKIGIMGALIGILTSSTVSFAESSAVDTSATDDKSYDYVVTETDTYNTDNESEYDFGFEDTITVDGVSYSLDHITYDVVSQYESLYGDVDIPDTIKIKAEDPVMADEKDDYISNKRSVEENGFTYSYSDIDFSDSDENIEFIEKTVETEVILGGITDYDYKATVTYEDEDTGEEYELPFIDYSVKQEGWFSGYHLYGTISDYDSSTYVLGDYTFEHSDDPSFLTQEELKEVMDTLGYSKDYRGLGVHYDGEEYTANDGIVYRDYIIDADMYGTIYNVHYGMEVDKTEYYPEITYELSESSKEEIEELKNTFEVTANGYYNIKEVKAEKKLTTVQKVAIGIGIILGIILIIALIIYLMRGGRKRTEIMSNREARDEFKNL